MPTRKSTHSNEDSLAELRSLLATLRENGVTEYMGPLRAGTPEFVTIKLTVRPGVNSSGNPLFAHSSARPLIQPEDFTDV